MSTAVHGSSETARATTPGCESVSLRSRSCLLALAHLPSCLACCCLACLLLLSVSGANNPTTSEATADLLHSPNCQRQGSGTARQKKEKQQKDLHVSCVFLVSLLFWGSDYLPSVAVKHIADPLLGFCLKEKLVGGCLGCGCAWLCCAVWCPGLGTSAGEAQQMGQLATGIAANRGKGGGKGGFCGLCGCGWGWGQTKPRTKSAEQQQAGSRDRRGPGCWQLAKKNWHTSISPSTNPQYN